MRKSPRVGWLLSVRRLGLADTAEVGDGALLTRYVQNRDEAVFEAILRRHGDMVLRVCRRHLNGTDAEDAFQAVFLVLARDADRIGNRESLAGWLFRVAYHVSRKIMGKTARRPTFAVRDEDRVTGSDAADAFERDELRAIVEEEVHALPDRFRGPVVLCYLEGRSNSEAAAMLGCPRGTVDSRLATARQKLRSSLLKRGVSLSGAALGTVWAGESSAGPLGDLSARTLHAVMEFGRTGSAAGAVSSHVLSIVAGVVNTMTANKLPLIVALAVSLCLMGSAGTVYLAAPDGKTPTDPPPAKPNDKPPAAIKTVPKPDQPNKPTATSEEIHAKLRKAAGLNGPLEAMPLKDLLEYLSERYDVPIRIDIPAFAQLGLSNAAGLYEQQVKLPVVRGMSLGDVLRDALAQIPQTGGPEDGGGGGVGQVTYRIRDGQILIVPAFVTPFSSVGSPPPGSDSEPAQVTRSHLLLQDEGEPISFSVEEKPLTDVLKELRRMTGANIVLDARQKDKAKLEITAEMHDVRLLAGLRILCDMCELQPVSLNNIYYITSKQNAEKLQKELDHKRYGEPQQLQPNYGIGGLGGGPGLGGLGGGPGLGGGGPGLGGGLGGAVPTPSVPTPAPPPTTKTEPMKPVEKKP
jgi:RNA polymerase sigma factor (sigma-70 family)